MRSHNFLDTCFPWPQRLQILIASWWNKCGEAEMRSFRALGSWSLKQLQEVPATPKASELSFSRMMPISVTLGFPGGSEGQESMTQLNSLSSVIYCCVIACSQTFLVHLLCRSNCLLPAPALNETARVSLCSLFSTMALLSHYHLQFWTKYPEPRNNVFAHYSGLQHFVHTEGN